MDSENRTQYVMLNGKNSKDFGVERAVHSEWGRLRYSNLERTLVDLVVRPQYSGGISSVLLAYVKAKARVDVTRLMSTLEHLDHVYPYHQAV